jgi:hypothetical protein
MTGDSKELNGGEFSSSEDSREHLQRSALMGHDPDDPFVASQSHHLHGQGTDIHPHASQRVFFWQRLVLTGVGFVCDGATYASKASLSKIEDKEDTLLTFLAARASRQISVDGAIVIAIGDPPRRGLAVLTSEGADTLCRPFAEADLGYLG